MQFSFEVGEHEKHTVNVSYDQMFGVMRIHVDGREVIKEQHTLSLSLVRTYEFFVGTAERHAVKIKKKRKLILAGLRKQKYSVYVDGRLIGEYEGK